MQKTHQTKNILITGCSGYLGSHIAKTLLARGFTIWGTTRDRQKAITISKEIHWLEIDLKEKEKITEEGLAKSSAKLLKPNTVLMALVGATIGRVAYLTFEATTNQNVTGLYPKDENELIPKYLFYALMNDFDKNFGDRKGKFTMANLTMIKNLEIPLPTFAEQKKLVDIIEAKEKEIEAIKLSLSNIKNEKEEVLTKHL